MLQNMNDVIFRTNENGEWQFLNPAWEKLTGLPVSRCLDRPVAELIPSKSLEMLKKYVQPVVDGDVHQCQFDWRFRHKNGDSVDVVISLSSLRSEEDIFEGIVGNIHDVTDRKAMELNLISARRHAEDAADAKTRFLANMSHEIRTPMNGVIGFTQLLLDSELTDEQRGQAKMIFDSGDAMMRLLNNILDLSKVEAGQIKTSQEPFDIRHVIKSCMNLMAPTANQKGLALELDIAENVPENIVGDNHHLRQILLNLLGNALKFTQEGHIKLRAFITEEIDGAGLLNIAIEDSGIGISANRLTAIFDPFEQAESSTTQRFGGSGLGLTISRQLAAIMEGDISVESTIGQGTTFCLKIPIKLHQNSQQSKDETMEIELLGKPLSGQKENEDAMISKGRLLLVEDHDVNQMLITAMTRRLGYETELAVDGADAVEKVDAAMADGKLFDLILMDVQMPVMDGYQATRMIRASGITAKQLPIVAITANAYSEDIESCLAAGMQAHVAKPVMIDKLQSTLVQWITLEESCGYASLTEPEVILSIEELTRKYRQRKEEVIHCLTSIVRNGVYSENEMTEAADHLHKLAGTAAMFGDENLGIKAKLIENGLTQWKINDRARNMKVAVSDFLKAA